MILAIDFPDALYNKVKILSQARSRPIAAILTQRDMAPKKTGMPFAFPFVETREISA